MTRILVRARNAHEYDGCEYALVEIAPELARLATSRRELWQRMHEADGDFYEAYFWDCAATFYDLGSLAFDDYLDDKLGADTAARLNAEGWTEVPDEFELPADSKARTECDQMIVRDSGIAWCCYPKHTDVLVTSDEIPHAIFRRGALAAE